MREGINFGRLCANIPRKIPKENMRNNRVEVRWKVWNVAPLGGLSHQRAILVSVRSVWKNRFRLSSAITKEEDCGGKAEYGRARLRTSCSVTASFCVILFFPLLFSSRSTDQWNTVCEYSKVSLSNKFSKNQPDQVSPVHQNKVWVPGPWRTAKDFGLWPQVAREVWLGTSPHRALHTAARGISDQSCRERWIWWYLKK